LFRRRWLGGGSLALLMLAGMPAHAQQPDDDAILADPDFDAALPPIHDLDPTPDEAPSGTVQDDPSLIAPLPPIATFEADAPPETSATITPDDEDMPEIAYDLVIQGLKEIGLDSTFRDLSALLEEGRKAANAAQISARADEDKALAERLMRSEGYYDGLASIAIDTLPNAKNRLTVTLTATPGQRYTLGDIVITRAEGEAGVLAREALNLNTGDPIAAARIEAAEANVALRLPEQGYPFAEVGARDVLLDERDRTGTYTLTVTAGPKARFGGIRTAGDPVFDAEHVGVIARFDRGELYDSRMVDDLRQALIATSLFSTAAVEPVRTGIDNGDGTETVDLLVRQSEGPQRQLAASAGYGTGEGIIVRGTWTHRNLFPPEGALTVSALAGTRQQNVGVDFRRSNAGQRDRTFALGASVARQDFAAYNARTVTLNGSLARASTPIFQKKWTWSLGAEIIATRETPFEAERAERDPSTYFIGALPMQIGYDGSDSLLDPTRGFRVTLRASPEGQKRNKGPFDSYGRLLGEASAYYPVTGAIVIAGRARVGSILGAARDDIAPSRRLYAGGGGSVRGFGFQQLGPKDVNNDPLGGRSLTEFALEARYRFGNFGIVPFIDAGRVGEGSTPSLSNMRYGVGIGGRYYTNFGPLRIDVATPINRQPGESRIALYISIGQAF
jgi:translocation and assembly module TamA